jgi:hypothetical protein
MKVDYCYSAQIERVLKHLVRIFSEFQIQIGKDSDGNPEYKRVPCRYGDMSRQTAVIMNNGSENVAQTAPMMVLSISSLKLSRENIRAPVAEQTMVGINKKNTDGTYSNELNGYYEIERLNPIPWELEFKINIWTTNTTNKLELFEQISTLFAPSVQFQLSTNPYDWSSSSNIELTDYNYSSRNFPQGTSYTLDISDFSFKTMVWLTTPNKVDRANIIQKIVTSLSVPTITDYDIPLFGQWDYLPYDVYTPGNHNIRVLQSGTSVVLTLLTDYGSSTHNGATLSWKTLFSNYTNDTTGSQISLLKSVEDENPILCSINSYTANQLQCTVNTNTYPTTNQVIDYILDSTSTFESIINTCTNLTYIGFSTLIEEFTFMNNTINSSVILAYDPTLGSSTVIQLSNVTVCEYNSEIYIYDNKKLSRYISSTYTNGFWRVAFPNS